MKSFKFKPRTLIRLMNAELRGSFAQLFGPTPGQIALQTAINQLQNDVMLAIMLPQLHTPLPYRNWFPNGATPAMISKLMHSKGNLVVLELPERKPPEAAAHIKKPKIHLPDKVLNRTVV